MAKSKDKRGEETQINDLEAFEEWEDELGPEETVPPLQEEKPAPAEDEEIAFSGFEQMEADKPASAEGPLAEEESPDALSGLAPDVPVNLVAVIGKITTSVGDLLKLRQGNVVELGRPPGETVDVVAAGRLIARGELVDIDGTLGVRILKLVK